MSPFELIRAKQGGKESKENKERDPFSVSAMSLFFDAVLLFGLRRELYVCVVWW